MSSNARAEYRKRTQQRQTVIFGSIIAVMAVLLVFGTLVWYGILPFPDKKFSQPPTAETVVCPTADAAPTDPSTITVNVYNATNRSGLAGNVAASLATAGVVISGTANWAGDELEEPVRIYAGPAGVTNAYTLRAYFPGATVHADPNMTSQVVEVVVGTAYSEMVTAPTKEDFTAAMSPIKGCVPFADFS
ncbi:LytR C-terminal domain-containing protein [Trueperella pecoris]|uniref:LytR C-terminal domain-containing protein n=1 Tax=Trueperella pecoris TaxID=2733571 RepID=A0A7M1R030_9ACTO|nr:LytR C-terminal domain-containing protein [Trueperella pecoris]QOR47538.1 LytR C-terminal domain-containing protein [Trueperella pecoris]